MGAAWRPWERAHRGVASTVLKYPTLLSKILINACWKQVTFGCDANRVANVVLLVSQPFRANDARADSRKTHPSVAASAGDVTAGAAPGFVGLAGGATQTDLA